jgi:hypothetical protein
LAGDATPVPEAPIELSEPVPAAALCTAPAATLGADLAGSGALWWHGGDLAQSTPLSWPTRDGSLPAIPTDPNAGNGARLRTGAGAGLQCRAGTHCGFVAPDAAPEASTATLALRWATPHGEEARTLLTLNTGGAARKAEGENYLFLSETEGILSAKDDAGLVAAELPCTGAGPHLTVASLATDTLALFLDGEETRARAGAPVLQGTASLFIAARNQRPKLFKTLGSALILDVWLWPGRALLLEDDPGILNALRRYHLWAEA